MRIDFCSYPKKCPDTTVKCRECNYMKRYVRADVAMRYARMVETKWKNMWRYESCENDILGQSILTDDGVKWYREYYLPKMQQAQQAEKREEVVKKRFPFPDGMKHNGVEQ